MEVFQRTELQLILYAFHTADNKHTYFIQPR